MNSQGCDDFLQLFNWFQLFFYEKEIPNIAGHRLGQKWPFWKWGVDGFINFHWFLIFLFSIQNHPSILYYFYVNIGIFNYAYTLHVWVISLSPWNDKYFNVYRIHYNEQIKCKVTWKTETFRFWKLCTFNQT